jgi:type VI secretion system secreted protein Hcp
MASPAYVWIVDDQGNEIKGDCNVENREGSIEAFEFEYGVEMPVDKFNGSTNGTRQHDTAMLTKGFDPTSPVLFQAACDGRTLKQVTIKWFRINESGKEEEYFTHLLDDVKVVSYRQRLAHTKDTENNNRVHEDITQFRFGKITIKHHDGNIEGTDTWLKRS